MKFTITPLFYTKIFLSSHCAQVNRLTKHLHAKGGSNDENKDVGEDAGENAGENEDAEVKSYGGRALGLPNDIPQLLSQLDDIISKIMAQKGTDDPP